MEKTEKERKAEYAREWRNRPENIEKCRELSRKYHEANREKLNKRKRDKYIKIRKENPEYAREQHLITRYSLTLKDFERKLRLQGFSCPICHCPLDLLNNRPVVDHDHSCCPGLKTCGKCVRDLLCDRCNRVLGTINESIDLLEGMRTYLLKFDRDVR